MDIFNNAGFVITEVKVHEEHTAIQEVKMGWVKDKKAPSKVYHFTREEVIAKLDDKRIVVTWNEEKQVGQLVRKFHRNGDVYIRTDNDDTEEDNLGDLPTYK